MLEKQVTVEHSFSFSPEELAGQEGAFIEALRGAVLEARSSNPGLEGYRLTDIGFLPEKDRIHLRLYFQKNN